MPAVYYHTNESGLDIEDTIEKLLEVEKQPINRYQKDIKLKKVKVKAWKTLQASCQRLQKTSEKLFGFRAPFGRSTLQPSQKNALDGIVKKGTKNSQHQMHIMQLASTHKVASDSLAIDKSIGAGVFTITVGEESTPVQFKGGTLKDLSDTIQKAVKGISTNLEALGGNSQNRLILESKTAGSAGLMTFADPNAILSQAGVLNPAKEETKVVEILFTNDNLKSYEPEKLYAGTSDWKVLAQGDKLRMIGPIAKRLSTKVEMMMPGTEITFEWYADVDAKKDPKAKKGAPDKSKAAIPVGRRIGPDTSVNIGGIVTDGYQVERKRQNNPKLKNKKKAGKADNSLPPDLTFRLSDKKGKETQVIFEEKPSKYKAPAMATIKKQPVSEMFKEWLCEIKPFKEKGGKITCRIPKAGKASPMPDLIFESRNNRSLQFTRPIIKKPKFGGNTKPKNVLAKPQDAKLKLNGAEMVRDRNTKLEDVIEGVVLNLKNTTKGDIKVSVVGQKGDAKQDIKDFVEAYNKLKAEARLLSKVSTANYGQDDERRSQNGVLASDPTIRRLISSAQTIIIQAYPSNVKPFYKALPSIGVSTGEVGKDWREIKAGLLLVEEEKLESALSENPLAVKELFGSDNNSDGRIDDGVAYHMAKTLKPYTRFTRGLLESRVKMLEGEIKDTKKRIATHEDHLEKFEKKTRDKFRRMEQALKKSKGMSDYLKNNNPNRK